MRAFAAILPACLLGVAASCADGGDIEDDRDEPFESANKADGASISEGSAEAVAVLRVANELALEVLDGEVGLTPTSAAGIVERRLYATLAALDDVPYVGPSALGKMLAYARRRGWVTAGGGFAPRILGRADDGFVVSPDGTHVVIRRDLKKVPGTCATPQKVGALDVWTFVEGSAPSRRTVATESPEWGTWFSDDGRYLVFVEAGNPCTHSGELWVANGDGSDPRRLADLVSPASIQVAGDLVVFDEPHLGDGNPSTYDATTHLARLPAGEPVPLRDVTYKSEVIVAPHGRAVAILDDSNVGRVTLFGPDGGSVQLTPATRTPPFVWPRWSPDGRKLAYLHGAGGGYTVTVVDADGSNLVDLAGDAATDFIELGRDHVAWAVRGVDDRKDIIVHRLTDGKRVRLSGATTRDESVTRVIFSSASDRVFVRVLRRPFGGAVTSRLLTASLDGDGPLAVLAPTSGWWDVVQAAGGRHVAVSDTAGTRFVDLGDLSSVLVPGWSPVEVRPGVRGWLAMSSQRLAVYPADFSGAGETLPGFDWHHELESAGNGVDFRRAFPFGWWGDIAVYPGAIDRAWPSERLTMSLLAWRGSPLGTFATKVIRFAVTEKRLTYVTDANVLYVLERP